MSLAEQATPYMVAAARTYGGAVLGAARGPRGDAAVTLGQRLMHQIFGVRDPDGQLPKVVEDLITHPDDGTAAPAALEDHVQGALCDDPDLTAAIGQELLAFYRREIAAGNLQAMVDLGDLLRWQEDYEGARTAYQRAAQAGNAHWAARALVFLGVMLRKSGDRQGARAAFQRVVDSGNAEWAPSATVELLNLP